MQTTTRNNKTTFPNAPAPTMLIIVVNSKTAAHNPRFTHTSSGSIPGITIPSGPKL